MDREERESEYDGHKYHPDAKEDLVHKEVDLPDNAPREYQDPNVLWNAVEMVEKNKNAQLCRMMKASLPNNWSYEVAKETVRQYVMENFVSKGMCCEWAIHDSVNKHGQRNLHFHCLMTMKSMDENGKWLPKQRKVYILDEHGAIYDKLAADHDKGTAKVDVLSAEISAWERYKGFMEAYNKSQSLKGLARLKFDKENRTTLDAMPREYERFRKVIPKGEKITPDAWRKEIDKIIDGQDPILKKWSGKSMILLMQKSLGTTETMNSVSI
jgi:hypothetical protein